MTLNLSYRRCILEDLIVTLTLTNTHGACDVRDQRRRCTLDGNSSSLGMHQTRDIEIFEDLLVDRYMGWMNERVSGRGRVLWQI